MSPSPKSPPDNFTPPQQALWWLKEGGFVLGAEWETAHGICQTAEGTFEYDLVHALAHWIEGDISNRDYWYRRVGRGWTRAFDDVLLFAKLGLAFIDLDLTSSVSGRKDGTLTGGVAGIGAEYAVNEIWSLRAEADVYGFSDDAVLAGASHDFDLGQGVVRFGVAMKF